MKSVEESNNYEWGSRDDMISFDIAETEENPDRNSGKSIQPLKL